MPAAPSAVPTVVPETPCAGCERAVGAVGTGKLHTIQGRLEVLCEGCYNDAMPLATKYHAQHGKWPTTDEVLSWLHRKDDAEVPESERLPVEGEPAAANPAIDLPPAPAADDDWPSEIPVAENPEGAAAEYHHHRQIPPRVFEKESFRTVPLTHADYEGRYKVPGAKAIVGRVKRSHRAKYGREGVRTPYRAWAIQSILTPKTARMGPTREEKARENPKRLGRYDVWHLRAGENPVTKKEGEAIAVFAKQTASMERTKHEAIDHRGADRQAVNEAFEGSEDAYRRILFRALSNPEGGTCQDCPQQAVVCCTVCDGRYCTTCCEVHRASHPEAGVAQNPPPPELAEAEAHLREAMRILRRETGAGKNPQGRILPPISLGDDASLHAHARAFRKVYYAAHGSEPEDYIVIEHIVKKLQKVQGRNLNAGEISEVKDVVYQVTDEPLTENPFRPTSHPLSSVTKCPKCGSSDVSLPSHPGDYFDCDKCGHSWPMTAEQQAKMVRKNPGDNLLPGWARCKMCGRSFPVESTTDAGQQCPSCGSTQVRHRRADAGQNPSKGAATSSAESKRSAGSRARVLPTTSVKGGHSVFIDGKRFGKGKAKRIARKVAELHRAKGYLARVMPVKGGFEAFLGQNKVERVEVRSRPPKVAKVERAARKAKRPAKVHRVSVKTREKKFRPEDEGKPATLEAAKKHWRSDTKKVLGEYPREAYGKGETWSTHNGYPTVVSADGTFSIFFKMGRVGNVVAVMGRAGSAMEERPPGPPAEPSEAELASLVDEAAEAQSGATAEASEPSEQELADLAKGA